MKILAITLFGAITFSGCTTTDLTCEVRVKRTDFQVERIKVVQDGQVSSSRRSLEPFRSDGDFRFYQYSTLLHGTRKAFVVVDFESPKSGVVPSDVFDLSRTDLSIRSDWSDWFSPHFSEAGADWKVLHDMKAAGKKSDSSKKFSQMRYKNERWNP